MSSVLRNEVDNDNSPYLLLKAFYDEEPSVGNVYECGFSI